MHDLSNIKQLRQKHNLNQHQLAQLAGVSQSLIAKIEAGRVDPTYSNAQKILQVFDQLRKTTEKKAAEIMNEEILCVKANENVKETIAIMKQHAISQLPVVENNKICGLITESGIVEKMLHSQESIDTLTAAKIMQAQPPIISHETGLTTISHLLQHHSIVVVSNKGENVGIISKTDLLEHL